MWGHFRSTPTGEELAQFPRHVAIIMDGNGRWAKKRGLPRTMGHREGVKSIQALVEAAEALHLQALTLFAFSTENWKRPKEEVDFLMNLLKQFLDGYVQDLLKRSIRIVFLGAIDALPGDLGSQLRSIETQTKDKPGLIVAIAINYGSQQEIVKAVQAIVHNVSSGALDIQTLTPQAFNSYLDTRDLPPLDLLIRTSGEERLSNFLLYQSAYTEFFFSPILFPDFRKAALIDACRIYAKRQRRFGGL